MQLDEFFAYKNTLMKDLLTNEAIVHLIDDDLDFENAAELAYTRVFPYEFVPETIEHGDTYVCFDVDITKSMNKTFLCPVLYIWVFCHKSKQRLPEGGVRQDKLCAEIAKAINGSREYGLGELDLYSVKRFAPQTDYNGKLMMFNATDFNRQHDPKRYIPANRKG